MNQKKPFVSTQSPIMAVYCEQEFSQLSQNEKEYSYHFAKASWEGSKICYFQKAYEAPALFTILQLVHSGQSTQTLKQNAISKGVSEDDLTKFIFYSAGVLNNCGNFNSFGDSKFIPEISPETFRTIVQSCTNYGQYATLLENLFADIQPFIFGYQGLLEKIGYPPEGSTGYYSGNLTKGEIEMVDEFLKVVNVDPLNTRALKFGEKHYGVLVASVNQDKKVHFYQGNKIEIIHGDFSPILRRVSWHLEKAVPFAANKNQEKMLTHYVNHFINGDIEIHKESQRAWVKDVGPIVESNIGFIETYLDPRQVRAEFEGFVAVVDKKRSEKTNYFVSRAPEFLMMLPWPSDFEKDAFLKPDFTCLSVLSFGSSGTPLGINIPNYDDIRQEEGFKNVYLGNCITSPKDVLFLDKEDVELKLKHFPAVIYHKVIFHELLGHGCGKLFYEGNYDSKNIVNPLTNEKGISKCYKQNETWGSVFKNLSNPYEECRADSVALYFSAFKEAYEVLQPEQLVHWEEISAACFLQFIYEALNGLQFFNAEDKKWGQAHVNGRWVILQVLLEAGNDFVTIEKIAHPDDSTKSWIKVKMDRTQVLTTGKEAMGKFLVKLQVYKSSADIESATEMFGNYSKVNDKFLEIRQIVIDNKKPRRLELQGNILKDFSGNLTYKTYPETAEGIIQSYVDRFPYFDREVVDLWNEYRLISKPSL